MYVEKKRNIDIRRICGIFTNQMSIAGLKPDTVVLTNKRFILYHPGLLGCKFDDFLWRDLINVKLNEGLMGAKLIFEANNQKITVDKLPKSEARKAYSMAQEKEQEASETRRQRQMQENWISTRRFAPLIISTFPAAIWPLHSSLTQGSPHLVADSCGARTAGLKIKVQTTAI